MSNITKLLSKHAIENTPDFLFVHNGYTERNCSACQHKFIPTVDDISTRRPSTFCKTCFRCRDRFNTYRRNKQLADVQKYINSLSSPS